MGISSAVDASAVARVVGIKTEFKDLRGGSILFLPQRIAVVGQGSTVASYDNTKVQVTSSLEAATKFGFGSPVHLSVEQLLPINGDGVGTIPVTIYPLDDDGSGVASAGDITPSGSVTTTASYIIKINNIASEAFIVEIGDDVADITASMTTAINAVLKMPIVATDGTTVVDLESKWKGTSANDLVIEVIETIVSGVSFAITQPTGGLVNPDVDDSLNQIGNVWETLILNCFDIDDTTSLDKYSNFGEGRWGALTKKPLMVFTGNTKTTVVDSTVVSDTRKTDRVNAQLVAPGSKDLPFVVASRQLARIAKVANNNPPHDYGSQPSTGLTPGTDGEQWDYLDRDAAIKKGSSTIEVKDGVINLSDTVTFYHPEGDPIPAYRYIVDIMKIQTIIFNLALIFATAEWDGAPLIPDDQPTVNPKAKKPKTAVADIASMVDSLGLNALISDPKTAKKNIQATISDQNPKRLDVVLKVQLSGNANIISIDLNFGFYFGVIATI